MLQACSEPKVKPFPPSDQCCKPLPSTNPITYYPITQFFNTHAETNTHNLRTISCDGEGQQPHLLPNLHKRSQPLTLPPQKDPAPPPLTTRSPASPATTGLTPTLPTGTPLRRGGGVRIPGLRKALAASSPNQALKVGDPHTLAPLGPAEGWENVFASFLEIISVTPIFCVPRDPLCGGGGPPTPPGGRPGQPPQKTLGPPASLDSSPLFSQPAVIPYVLKRELSGGRKPSLCFWNPFPACLRYHTNKRLSGDKSVRRHLNTFCFFSFLFSVLLLLFSAFLHFFLFSVFYLSLICGIGLVFVAENQIQSRDGSLARVLWE